MRPVLAYDVTRCRVRLDTLKDPTGPISAGRTSGSKNRAARLGWKIHPEGTTTGFQQSRALARKGVYAVRMVLLEGPEFRLDDCSADGDKRRQHGSRCNYCVTDGEPHLLRQARSLVAVRCTAIS